MDIASRDLSDAENDRFSVAWKGTLNETQERKSLRALRNVRIEDLTRSGYRFFDPFWGFRGSFQTQDMLKRSIINEKIW